MTRPTKEHQPKGKNIMQAKAVILSYNTDAEHLCACAARISTTPGTATEIYRKTPDAEKDRKLVANVIRSGHRSVIEHAVFHIAFEDVSVAVEEFVIEFRLASYTVKSRRYVDYGTMGYYVPNGLTEEGEALYRTHVDSLFADYNFLNAHGIPKEDSRFVLPYCFYSNFYCTVNARELIHMVQEMKYGRGREDAELCALADQLIAQLADVFPVAASRIVPYAEGTEPDCTVTAHLPLSDTPCEVRPAATLLSLTPNGEKLICEAASLLCPDGAISSPAECMRRYPRTAEQVSAAFRIDGLSLSSVTHLVRHRMQSSVIPPLSTVDPNRYIVPDTVAADAECLARYRAAFARNAKTFMRLRDMGLARESCLCLSGNTLSVMTTQNARELMLFFRLRTCNRAQWEIREVAQSMLGLLQHEMPAVFCGMGPSCVLTDRCPEGRLSCGRMEEMRRIYRERG